MKRQIVSLIMIAITLFSCSVFVPMKQLRGLEDGFLANYEDVENINEAHKFGNYVKSELIEKEQMVGGEKVKKAQIVFKLFGLIPVKKVNVVLSEGEQYYVGGVPIGLSICTDGAIVVGDSNNLKDGDLITHINGQKVVALDQIDNLLNENDAQVRVLRKNKEMKTLLKTSKDDMGRFKLGLWAKDDVSGVGTLTFVNTKTLEYGALGHPIMESGNVVPVSSGKVFDCSLIGIEKGKKNDPGELKCVFMPTAECKGTIQSNSKFGISGVLNDTTNLVDENLTAPIGGRLGVKMGDAVIVSSISGIREEYHIEIIKANYQKTAKDKSMVFRVKDERLLKMTGGIVQGMSGSPIMQDGKIIGAVTHVFLNDPTKGYAVYADWMV